MLPLHARSARLSSMWHYRRQRQRAEFRKARRVMSVVRASRWRIGAVLASIALLFVEVGFLLGALAGRWR